MLYIDQKPKVSSKTDNPANGVVHVTFSDITLSMSLNDASWLAANIQREIRKVEAEHPDLSGVSYESLLALTKDSVVVVRDDAGNEAEYVVKQEPWRLGHGQWVIGLKGIAGGYSLDRVMRIIRLAEKNTCSS